MGIEELNHGKWKTKTSNYSTKDEELKDVLEMNEIQWFKIDFIKELWYDFHIFWSWSEVLDWEKDLKMGDLDVQIVIKNEKDKENIIKKLQDLLFEITDVNDDHIIAEKDWKEYDFHFVKKVNRGGWFMESGYLEWPCFFPESGYKEKDWIKYIKLEITYIMATNSRNLWNNNEISGINIENEIEWIDKKAVIIMDFIEDVIFQKKWKSIFKNKNFIEIIKIIKEFLEEYNGVSNDKIEQVKVVIEQIDDLSELKLQNLKNDCLKYRKIQRQVKRISRLKDKIDYEEVKRLQWLFWFIKK